MTKLNDFPTFYCPYAETIITIDAIWEAKKKMIAEMKISGYSEDEIDDFIELGIPPI